jgi:hypothetical protein
LENSESLTFKLSNRLSVRLYQDSRPHCLETAALQKGLVLLFDGEELIEEGIGFGVPVIKYKDKTFFSSSAMISIKRNNSKVILQKKFVLDVISRKRLKDSYINDNFYEVLHKSFEKLYLANTKGSVVFNKIMELRDVMKIKTEFFKVKPRGVVTIEYQCQSSMIKVSADFSELNLQGCQEVLILNEQGSTVFKNYQDSTGLKLVGNKIGAWNMVVANEAFLFCLPRNLKFGLRKAEGAMLFRGWEMTKNRFSWTGLSYSINPNKSTFDYTILFS